MKEKQIKLAKNFSIPATEYASQANANLGIRDSGKTYTAMKAAEQLLIAKIPIIVYDPVGVWKNIRKGVNGKKGFPVIVAGGDSSADILLTPENAVQIVRAAMRAGISIILDLYSPSLANKSKWIKIVQETMDVLMYENADYGLRHIFLEEASEFIPQRVQPQQGKVYSSIERVARMGRNASLGMTIINQRAEEINKAVLELCAMVFLHKQVGKNSLNSIKKWFDLLNVSNTESGKAIVGGLSTLRQGECFVINTNDIGSDLSWWDSMKILPKQTYHPSPEKGVPVKAAKSNANISQFIKKLNNELNKKEKEPVKKTVKDYLHQAQIELFAHKQNEKHKSITDNLVSEIHTLLTQNKELKKQLDVAKQEISALSGYFEKARTYIITTIGFIESTIPICKEILKIKLPTSKVKEVAVETTDPEKRNKKFDIVTRVTPVPANPILDLPASGPGQVTSLNKMVKGVSMYPMQGISKRQLAILVGMSFNSGTFGNYYRKLIRDGIVSSQGDRFVIASSVSDSVRSLPALSSNTDELVLMWNGILGPDTGVARIFMSVANMDGQYLSVDDTAMRSEMSNNSGTFGNYYRKIVRMGLIEKGKEGFRLSPNFVMPTS